MLHLMLVDDEPLAVGYLADAIREWDKYELVIHKAYTGMEAMDKMRGMRLDILLTDIRMPGMGGLELADLVREQWPRCKIIFLSGYSDFDYIQTAIRKGGMDYVLKTEGDDSIFQAIEKAAEEIVMELQEGDIVIKAHQLLLQSIPTLRRDYLLDLLTGEAESDTGRAKRFTELGIGLEPDQPVYIAFGRVDDWGAYQALTDKSLMLYSIQNIAEEFLTDKTRFLFVPIDRFRFVWLIQPKSFHYQDGTPEGEGWERLGLFVKGTSESVQATCRKLLKLPVSLILSSQPCEWKEAARQFDTLKLMLSGGLVRSKEMLVTESGAGTAAGGEGRSSQTYFAETMLRNRMRKLDLLEAHLDNGDKQQFVRMFEELTRFDALELTEAKITYLTLELFANLSAFFLSYVNRRNLVSVIAAKAQLDKYTQMENHGSWQDAIAYYERLGEAIADYNGAMQQERTNDMIRLIHQYVHEFIREELSLTRLSEVVNLSPPYLSRIYKQLTGINLLDYITEVRVARAKHLLKNSSLKIHEVAAEVGFESAPYFTRLFKKITNTTPVEYRELT
ncbi:response regulator [Paenibacillus sp. LMG 31456]|uniref:Response regulator n=1 Tax=Paenibacillus foliorum TaxID=2654974 RepID=A0A972GX72_9BACL|nr:helix-turn-helix domain-containing protein [Paenibacillus foliorum]NOU94515.1 response regulator [Paenibacillus foliorum]